MEAPCIEVKNLKKYFKTNNGFLHAVDDVSFKIGKGKTMGIVGESGCGKSTLGRTIIHMHESTDGQIFYNGKDVTHVNGRELKELRTHMQIVFQDPYSSLNPRMTVEETIREPLELTKKYSKSQINEEVTKLMELCGVEERLRLAYPHEMDGGRRQRVGIARALSLNPDFIVCDEPVSALDVSIQAQVLNLLKDLQKAKGLTYMFVTHDLSVVRHISNDIGVMYLGQMVETSESKELFDVMLTAVHDDDADKTDLKDSFDGLGTIIEAERTAGNFSVANGNVFATGTLTRANVGDKFLEMYRHMPSTFRSKREAKLYISADLGDLYDDWLQDQGVVVIQSDTAEVAGQKYLRGTNKKVEIVRLNNMPDGSQFAMLTTKEIVVYGYDSESDFQSLMPFASGNPYHFTAAGKYVIGFQLVTLDKSEICINDQPFTPTGADYDEIGSLDGEG